MGNSLATFNCQVKGMEFEFPDDNKEHSVFIDIVELGQLPKPIEFGRIRSFVRLQRLYLAESSYADERSDFLIYDIFEHLRLEVDRERSLTSGIGASTVEDCELVDEMVESGPEIVNAISNDHRKGRVKWNTLPEFDDRMPFFISFVNNTLSIRSRTRQSNPDSLMEITKVVLSSVKF